MVAAIGSESRKINTADRIRGGVLADIGQEGGGGWGQVVNFVETQSRGEAIHGEAPRMSQGENEQMGF